MASARGWMSLLALVAAFFAQPLLAQTGDAARNVKTLGRQCDGGRIEACYRLGQILRDTEDAVLRDPAAAATAFTSACDRRHAQACSDLGELHFYGRGVVQSTERALTLYTEACESGNAEACFRLAEVNGRSPDLYEKACKGGYLNACSEQASILMANGGAAMALNILDRACGKRNEEACIRLGTWLLRGEEVPQNLPKGLAAIERGCTHGGGRACYELAALYEKGSYGISPDATKAARSYKNGCDAGDALSCGRYGDVLYLGRGVPANSEAALVAFDAGCAKDGSTCGEADAIRKKPGLTAECDAQNASSCLSLGKIYKFYQGLFGVPDHGQSKFVFACRAQLAEGCLLAGDAHWNAATRDVDGALRYYEDACTLGHAVGCVSLGVRLSGWPNMPTDEKRAAVLFARACDLKDKWACAERDRFAGLSPDVALADADAEYLPPEDGPLVPNAAQRSKCTVEETVVNGQTVRTEKCVAEEESDDGRYVLLGFAIKPGSAPWQALIERPPVLNRQQLGPTSRVLCGGSLIAKGWILTAAHCLYGDKKNLVTDGYRIRLGFNDVNMAQGLSYPIAQVIPHPRFRKDDPTYANDIALIRYDVAAPSKLGALLPQRTVRIDTTAIGARTIFAGMTAYAYGWGWTEAVNSQASNVLRGVKLALWTEPECDKVTRFTGALSNAVLCAGGPNGEQACSGDSGGPLIYYGDPDGKPTLIGVVSAGKRCGTMGEPSRYTRVAKSAAWIRSIVWPQTARR